MWSRCCWIRLGSTLSFSLFLPLFLLVSSSEHTSPLSLCPSGRINMHSSPAVHPWNDASLPASKVNDFISRTWAGSDPVSYIFTAFLHEVSAFTARADDGGVFGCLKPLPSLISFFFSGEITPLAWAGHLCVCVRERVNVRVGEEKEHTNMLGACAHFACKIRKRFLLYRVTFCHLRLFFLLDFLTPVLH